MRPLPRSRTPPPHSLYGEHPTGASAPSTHTPRYQPPPLPSGPPHPCNCPFSPQKKGQCLEVWLRWMILIPASYKCQAEIVLKVSQSIRHDGDNVKTTHERCGPFSLVVLSQRRGRVTTLSGQTLSETLKQSFS